MFYVIHNLYNVGIGCKDRKEVIGYGIKIKDVREGKRLKYIIKGGVKCLGNF